MLTASQILELVKSGEGYNVDFKRSVPSKVKEISDEVAGFANAAGGYVIIGVDNDNQIVGAEIDNNKRSAIQDTIGEISPTLRCDFYSVDVEGKKVWVIDVPSGKDKPYITGGVIYVREGANCQKLRSAEEIRAFFAECAKIYYDAIPCRWFDIDKDIEPDNFHTFMEMANLSDTLPIRRLFENLDLLTEEYVPKNAAALFFGREPERKFPHAVIRCL
jgi:ATP-dependent DNA helicase RecG